MAYITINTVESKPREIIVTVGKAGSVVRAYTETLARLITLHLRLGTPLPYLCKQLRGISSDRSLPGCLSLPDTIGQILEDYIGN